MSYNVRIYKNSGYNSTNIPDSPALLNSASYIDLPALDILQERFLQSIKVKALWAQVKDADYCRLTDGTDTWFYSVESVNMLATDVAELGVIPDFINSVGGIGAITILDGITERVHVASDNYGEWNSDDYLLTPNEPLQIKQTWYNTAQSVTNLRTVIESTVDPYLTADSEENVVFQDSTGNYSVCVPKVQGNRQETAYKVGNADSAYSPKTCLYPFYNGTYLTDLSDALATLRSLGIEQAVIAQVHLPSKFINFTLATQSDNSGHIYYYVQTAQGKDDIITTSGLDYEEYNVDNNLINYSAFMKYGLMTASGNGSEFDPADIFDSGVLGASSDSRLHSSSMTLHAAGKQKAAGKAAVLHSVFVPRSDLEGRYPYLRKYPFLLPAAWLQRVMHYLREQTSAAGHGAGESIRIGQERIRLLEAYGIIKK